MNPQGLLMERRKLHRFDDVYDNVVRLHDLNFPDQNIDLENLRVISDGNDKKPDIFVEVPGIGRLALTRHSKGQLGSILGIRWDKWFDPNHVKPEEIQEEITRRFARTNENRKIRARRYPSDAPGSKYADGVIRAVLSPTYAPIDDIRIFARLRARFRGNMSEVGFMKHLGADFYNDRASHYSVVGEPINMGPIDRDHPDQRVRHIYDMAEAEGKLPSDDWVYQGFHFRNSEVGYTAVTIDATTFRLVCLNGAIVTVKDGRLLYRMHRSLDDEAIDSLLDGAFRKMPAAWERNRRQMVSLRDAVLEDPEAEIIAFLTRQKTTKSFMDKVKEAWETEPLPNRYGVMQAISRAAQAELDMDKRAELEELAGRYLAAA
jgi:hypothetical protein